MTTEELVKQFESLSELEKQSFIEGMTEHLYRNKQLHLISDCNPEDPGIIEDLKDEIQDLEEQIRGLEFDKRLLRDSLTEERSKKETTKPLQP